MTPAQRTTVSFLDLALIMTGVMAMIASVGDNHPAVAEALSESFGATAQPVQRHALPLSDLFEPEEARLTAAGGRKIAALAEQSRQAEIGISVPVVAEKGASRLDRWELAAARTAAIMRVLADHGLADDALVPDLTRPGGKTGQGDAILTIREKPGRK